MSTGRALRHVSMIAACGMLAACGGQPASGYGFTLPEGEVDAGEATFVRLQCVDCHSVSGRDDLRIDVEPSMTVPLGGPTARIATYGELVTSVINPSHRISQRYIEGVAVGEGVSAMRNYNDVMTVSEMADIVMFLQEQYELQPYTPTEFRRYAIP